MIFILIDFQSIRAGSEQRIIVRVTCVSWLLSLILSYCCMNIKKHLSL